MYFDRLDESYAMVKSKLYFDKVTLTGLTGLCIPVRPVCTAVPILVVNGQELWWHDERRLREWRVSGGSSGSWNCRAAVPPFALLPAGTSTTCTPALGVVGSSFFVCCKKLVFVSGTYIFSIVVYLYLLLKRIRFPPKLLVWYVGLVRLCY